MPYRLAETRLNATYATCATQCSGSSPISVRILIRSALASSPIRVAPHLRVIGYRALLACLAGEARERASGADELRPRHLRLLSGKRTPRTVGLQLGSERTLFVGRRIGGGVANQQRH